MMDETHLVMKINDIYLNLEHKVSSSIFDEKTALENARNSIFRGLDELIPLWLKLKSDQIHIEEILEMFVGISVEIKKSTNLDVDEGEELRIITNKIMAIIDNEKLKNEGQPMFW
jgi:hypothetical protein